MDLISDAGMVGPKAVPHGHCALTCLIRCPTSESCHQEQAGMHQSTRCHCQVNTWRHFPTHSPYTEILPCASDL